MKERPALRESLAPASEPLIRGVLLIVPRLRQHGVRLLSEGLIRSSCDPALFTHAGAPSLL